MKWPLRLCEKVARRWDYVIVPKQFMGTLQAQLTECQAYGGRTLGKLLETISERDRFKAIVHDLENVPPIVPDEHVEAAKEYASYLDNCMISPEEKRRTCIVRLSEKFPEAKKQHLALALELGLKCLR